MCKLQITGTETTRSHAALQVILFWFYFSMCLGVGFILRHVSNLFMWWCIEQCAPPKVSHKVAAREQGQALQLDPNVCM